MMKQSSKQPGRAKKIVIGILAGIFLAAFVVAGSFCAYKLFNVKNTENSYKKLQAEVITEETSNDNGPPFEVDLDALRKENPDTVGWLYIPSLQISYPLMYSGDNDFYLHRTFEKNYAYAGSLFLDMYCKPDFSRANTIVYGHNMIDGSMFGPLNQIIYQNAVAEDPYFWIYTPKGTYQYRIFSAFDSDIYSDAFKHFDHGGQEFLDWCYNMKSASYIDTGKQHFGLEDKVVTLSTCGSSSFYRTLVLGVRVASYATNKESVEPDYPDISNQIIEPDEGPDLLKPLEDKAFYICLAVFASIAALISVLVLCARRKRHE